MTDEIQLLYEFLKFNEPNNLLMPCTSQKNPILPHKNNVWNWNKVKENEKYFGPDNYQAILIKDFIVIDIDSKSLIKKYEELFYSFKTCPKVETSKGAHYYFKRTKETDMYGMFDKARCFGVKDEEIDFKSICSTGTAGVIVVPPSKGKTWIRPLWNTPLLNFDGEILDYFYSKWSSRNYEYIIKADPIARTPKRIIADNLEEDSQFVKINLLDDEFDRIKSYMNCLDENRSINYPSWTDICWCLKNISAQYNDPDSLFKSLWIEFSKKCPLKYNYDNCVDKWYKTIPRKSGLKLGTLIMWAKEDNIELFDKLIKKGDLDDFTKKIIKEFVLSKFNYPPTRIDSINVKEYDSNKSIFININELYCKICNDTHNKTELFIIIDGNNAREKCHESNKICDNIIAYHKFPDNLKEILDDILLIETTSEKVIKDFIIEYSEKDPTVKNMNVTEISTKTDNVLGSKFDVIKGDLCPLHNVIHDKPSNCVFVNLQKAVMVFGCNIDPWGRVYPENGIEVPKQVINILGNVNIQNTINNNYIGDSDEIYSDLFNEFFDIFDDSELNKLINISFKGYASDIANLFYYIAGTNFGVSGNDKYVWWTWDILEMRWIQNDALVHLFCSETIASKFDRSIEWFRDNTDDDDLRKKRIYKIESILKRLKDKDQNSIMSQAAIIYKNKIRYFEESLDNNKNILNFHGEVYDFENLNFRKVTPEDRVTKTVGYSIPEIDLDKRKFIMDFLTSVMMDDKQLNYLLIWLASCLDGNNDEEKFHVLKGVGRNGKGVLRDLIAETLGSNSRGYYGTIVSSMLTKERPSSDKPIADLLHMKGKRFLAANEPEKSAKINNDFLKFLTGNDPINGRWLNSNDEIHFWPQHSLCVLCNDVPKLDSEDEASWIRTRIIEFPYKFVTHPKNDKEKKINIHLKSKMKGLGPHFMLILLEYYKIYVKEGLNPTAEVMRATNEVRDENDPYKEFIDTQLVESNNDSDRISQSYLNETCRKWITENKKYTIYKKISLKESMERIYGKLNKELWINNNRNAGWSFVKWKNSL